MKTHHATGEYKVHKLLLLQSLQTIIPHLAPCQAIW